MEIYALIGSSGTGKSHRAAFVANEFNTDLIIDDGLLIKGNSILGGVSAKSQPTRLGAVKTALFSDEDHARNAVELIEKENPERVLILGTSLGMAKKIAARLRLPEPEKVITIEDIATEKDIKTARHMRNIYGKHVIPVPTAEVRKTLSGLLADPVRVFLKLKNRPKPKRAVEKTLVRPTYFLLGKISIADNAIISIAKRVIEDSQKPVKLGKALVEQSQGEVRLNLTVKVKMGVFIPEIIREIQRLVKEKIEYMTGLNIVSVNVVVGKIDTGDY